MSEYLPTGAEAQRKFDQAKRQGTIERLVALLGGRPDDLLPFDDVQRRCRCRDPFCVSPDCLSISSQWYILLMDISNAS